MGDEIANSAPFDAWTTGVLCLAGLADVAARSNDPELAAALRERLVRIDAAPAGSDSPNSSPDPPPSSTWPRATRRYP